MDDAVRAALRTDQTIDITTIGRRSGRPHRIEIWLHHMDGHCYLSGSPGRRDWYANLLSEPNFQVHLKQSHQADLAARAQPIVDPARRQPVLRYIMERHRATSDLTAWLEGSPLVEITFEEPLA
ncbi:MAG TPA: nitroreductase/quinone reductase family protein [Anaerolineales bacterium]|jgi:hypothetical protein